MVTIPVSDAVDRIPSTLPRQLTTFIGREHELQESARLLQASRILTLTGAGGSGKTRLGLRLAAQVAGQFPDGVYFVVLDPVGDPGLVLSSIAQGVGLPELGDRPLPDRLHEHLGSRRVLLLLDNFEHLLVAAPVVARILQATTAVRIVVTSRSRLGVRGEQEFEVPPLQVPDVQGGSVDELGGVEAVRLFVERARAAVPGFALDDATAACVAEITRRLDGLPLAIELAAAQMRLLPPGALLARLEHSLGVLVGGARDLPARQQTLRATIAWSDGLLGGGARRLLAVCSVFRGGIGLDCLESVCATGIDVGVGPLEGVAELVDHSLLRRVEGAAGPRFGMLSTVGEYAAERLAESSDGERVAAAHAGTFLTLAESAAAELRGPGELVWLERLEVEHQNLRAALDWYQRHEPCQALRLAASMSRFWGVRGHFTEGRQRLGLLLGLCPQASATRVTALTGAASLAIDQGDHEAAGALLADGIQLAQALGDARREAMALVSLGRSLVAQDRPAEAATHLDRALNLLGGAGHPADMATAWMYSGLAALFAGHPEDARVRFERSVALCRQLGYRSWGARALNLLGHARLELGDLRGARAALEEALPTCIELGDRWVVPIVMAGLAAVAAATGRPRRALRLAGAAEGLCRAGQFSMPDVIQARLQRQLTAARTRVGALAGQLTSEGQLMSPSDAVSFALADTPDDAHPPGARPTLTRREREVASLVAQGLSNRIIAAQLTVSVRTIDAHVDHALTKLGFHSRTQLVAWAYESGLLTQAADQNPAADKRSGR